jgi:hypothetical protein
VKLPRTAQHVYTRTLKQAMGIVLTDSNAYVNYHHGLAFRRRFYFVSVSTVE